MLTNQISKKDLDNIVSNIDSKSLTLLEESLGLDFVSDQEEANVCLANSGEVRSDFRSTFTSSHLENYIYALLYSSIPYKNYKEFLKIGSSPIPYPKDQDQFWQLVILGDELQKTHLMISPHLDESIRTYPVVGHNIITRKMTKASPGFDLTNTKEKTGRVWINNEQYFDRVPESAWEIYIGNDQPAQSWLKDRIGTELKVQDIFHYHKLIVALMESERLKRKIDELMK